MQWIVLVVALAILVIGLYGLVVSDGLVKFARLFDRTGGIWTAAAFRLVFAFVFWFAAPGSAHPTVFRTLGVAFLIGAAALPIIGAKRFHGMIEWGNGLSTTALRGICLVVIAAGLYLAWAASSVLVA